MMHKPLYPNPIRVLKGKMFEMLNPSKYNKCFIISPPFMLFVALSIEDYVKKEIHP